MGNGAKAQQKRDRNAKDDKKAGSQLKTVRLPLHTAHTTQSYYCIGSDVHPKQLFSSTDSLLCF